MIIFVKYATEVTGVDSESLDGDNKARLKHTACVQGSP